MKAYLNQNGHDGRRGGFTVVEILVVITVIAILAAMLIPVVGGAMRRANEFAIQSEMTQLDMAIEQFKNDNGFYPPSFASISNGSQLMPYLNRIAPNHAYTTADLDRWWDGNGNPNVAVGTHIKHHGGADLVFWLSGISKNKQYPLSDPTSGTWLAPHAYDPNFSAERNVYFEFASSRLNFDGDGSGAANYLQAKGKKYDPSGNAAVYQYIDANTYGPKDVTVALPDFHAYHTIVNGQRVFFNPDSFQLVANGLDGSPGGNGNHHGTSDCGYACTGLVSSANLTYYPYDPDRKLFGSGLDNIVNFVNEGSGKLETKALGID